MSKVSTGRIVSLVLVIVVLWFGITYLVVKCGPNVGESGGVKGDAFGAVNALFSGLALAGVIIAILLQSQELKLQRRELKDTRKELRGQKDQLEAQVNGSLQKEFDSRFFETLRLYRQCVDGISLKGTPGHLIGAEALSYFSDFMPGASRRNEAIGDVFEKYNKSFGYQLSSVIQLLEAAVQMLSHDRAGAFHGQLLKATCGFADRRVFLYYALGKQSCLPKIADTLNRIAFLEGVIVPNEHADLQGLTYESFGLPNWSSMGRNAP